MTQIPIPELKAIAYGQRGAIKFIVFWWPTILTATSFVVFLLTKWFE